MSLLEIEWTPDRRKLRIFGLVGLPLLSILGAWLFFTNPLSALGVGVGVAKAIGCFLWGLAALCGSLAIARPGWLLPLYRILQLLGIPFGLVISILVMALIYYGIVTPLGFGLRVLGHDALAGRFRQEAESYWVPRKKAMDPQNYRRQF